MQKNVTDYRLKLKALDNSKLLKKALDVGEISLINYMLIFVQQCFQHLNHSAQVILVICIRLEHTHWQK